MTGPGTPTAVVLQPGQEGHETGGHPENAGRIEAAVEAVRASERFESRPSRTAEATDPGSIERVHDAAHVDAVRKTAESGGGWMDAETQVAPASYQVALTSAGGAISAVDSVLDGEAQASFAFIRPPGHHATPDRAMGFCLFNNAAVAARHAQAERGIERVAILDWDVHHGNGTQDVFYGDPSVLFISLHQWPLYPGTGWLDETGTGEARGTTLNLPMPPGSGDREWLAALGDVALPAIESFRPGLLIVSAGQDGHHLDGLSDQGLTAAGYREMAQATAGVAAGLGIGTAVVHEGGYNPATLPAIDLAILDGLDRAAGAPAGDGEMALAGETPAVEPPDAAEWGERLAAMKAAASSPGA